MSRLIKQPILIPQGLEVKIAGHVVTLKGPKGTKELKLHESVTAKVNKSELFVMPLVLKDKEYDDLEVVRQAMKDDYAMLGTSRAVLKNCVEGLTTGFTRVLDMVGVGYKAEVKGQVLHLSAGFSHPVTFEIPRWATVTIDKGTRIIISGSDKQAVGQFAADIREVRKPEPYKGKGVKYADEIIVRKVGKKK